MIVFPHVEQENDLNRDFYLGNVNPWDTPCTLTAATGDVTIKFTPVAAAGITMPFDGDEQMRAHHLSHEYLEQGDAAKALAVIADPAGGCYCEPSVGAAFYIARTPLERHGEVTIYAQSVIRPMATDGKRGFIYHVMSETMTANGIRWQIKTDKPRPSDSQGGLG